MKEPMLDTGMGTSHSTSSVVVFSPKLNKHKNN